MPRAKPDANKLAQLVLYLCLQSEGDRYFGLTKLYKLIFYCDFAAYRRFGESITGQRYRALPFGPVPDKMDRFIARLTRQNWLALRKEQCFGYSQKRPFCLHEPDVDVFKPKQLELIHSILDRFRQSTGTQISDASHQFLGWQVAEQGETIPYAVAVLDHGELTEREWGHAKKVERRAADWLASRAAAATPNAQSRQTSSARSSSAA